MKHRIFLFALLFAGCGDASNQETIKSPLVISDAQGPVLAFAHSSAGWQWVGRPAPGDRTARQALWPKVARAFASARGQAGALSFSASGGGTTTFSASVPGYGLVSQVAAVDSFSAKTATSTSFDPALGYGFAGQCDLTRFCDAAAAACRADEDCDLGEISECYSAVVSGAMAAEFGPYVCVIADFLSCAFETPYGDDGLRCVNLLAASGLSIDLDRL